MVYKCLRMHFLMGYRVGIPEILSGLWGLEVYVNVMYVLYLNLFRFQL